MATNVIRLVNGGSIQVRTGVLQGIGPQGPRGVAGPQGIDGLQGPQGEVGPMGQILQLSGLTKVSINNTLAAATDTTISFGSVSYDDLSCFTSISNITLVAAGDYLLACWLRFDAAGSGSGTRDVWFVTGTTTIARTTRRATGGGSMYVDLAFPYRAAANTVVNVVANSADATAISLGNMAVTRVGSGPTGGPGPTGPQGPVGPTGPKGDKGDDGSATGGFAHYSDLLP